MPAAKSPGDWMPRPGHPGEGLFRGGTSTRLRKFNGLLVGAARPEQECPVGGVNLTTTPFAPRAALALAAADFEGRIALYAARAALKLPLFPGVPRG